MKFLIFWKYIKEYRKKQLIGLVICLFICGMGEILPILSIGPLLSGIIESSNEQSVSILRIFENLNPFQNETNSLIFSTFIFLVIAFLSNGLRILTTSLNAKVSAGIGTEISSELYERTLYQNYNTHVTRDSSLVVSALTTKFTMTVNTIFMLLQLISNILISFFIVLALLLINFNINLTAFLIFIFLYILVSLIVNKRLKLNSKIINKELENQLKAINSGLGGIKEVILNNSQTFFKNTYIKSDREMRIQIANNRIISTIPKYFIEFAAISFALFISIFISDDKSNPGSTIAILGGLAFGTQRLLPAMQQIYYAWAYVKSYEESFLNIFDLIEKQKYCPNIVNYPKEKKFNFESLEFKNINYYYSNKNKLIFNNLSFSILKGQKIGIVGKTGVGKSTLMNIMLGLIEPTQGGVFINNLDLHSSEENISKWFNTIAHVSQDNFMLNETILANICFGEDIKKIDWERLEYSSNKAKIDKFINSQEKKYFTVVGERGLKLSGGEKQRIAIARAFYKDAKVIFFDEATSALDVKTEESLLETINEFNKDITLIMIAHKLQTLKKCDLIFNVKNNSLEIGNNDLFNYE